MGRHLVNIRGWSSKLRIAGKIAGVPPSAPVHENKVMVAEIVSRWIMGVGVPQFELVIEQDGV